MIPRRIRHARRRASLAPIVVHVKSPLHAEVAAIVKARVHAETGRPCLVVTDDFEVTS